MAKFKCNNCGKTFEKFCNSSWDAVGAMCPHCNSRWTEIDKGITIPSNFPPYYTPQAPRPIRQPTRFWCGRTMT